MPLTQHFRNLLILTVMSSIPCLEALGHASKLIDLTHDFDENIISIDNLHLRVHHVPSPVFNGSTLEEIQTPVHIGTHIDAPCFMDKSKWCVEAIPLEKLFLPAVVVDISQKVNGNPQVHLTRADLITWESIYGRIPDGSLLLINTGWSQFWSDQVKYHGLDSSGRWNFPSISAEAGEWLANNRNIYGIGIDSLSIDAFSGSFPIHRILLPRGVYGIECLKNLHLVPPVGSSAVVMPTKLKGLTGAPARVVVRVP